MLEDSSEDAGVLEDGPEADHVLPLPYTLGQSFSYIHVVVVFVYREYHRLNMELDLQSLFDVNSCSHWLRPRNSSLPPHLGSYSRGDIGQLR